MRAESFSIHCVCAVVCGLFAFAAASRGAMITLINGETIQGTATIDNGLFIQPEAGAAVKIDYGNILRAALSDTAEKADETIEPGVVLRNGVRLPCAIANLTDPVLKFPKRNLTVQSSDIAWVVYSAFSPKWAEKLPPGAAGALLSDGDFFEGAVKAGDSEAAKVFSPIFGLRTFTAKQKDFVALVLRDAKPISTPMLVKTVDGFLFDADSISGDRSGLTFHSPTFGMLKVDAKEVAQIGAGAARYEAVRKLKAPRIEPKGPESYSVDQTFSKLPLTSWGVSIPHGIETGIGVAVTWELPAGFNVLAAQGVLPAGADPGAHVSFAVYADGKLVFRSAVVAATDKPVPIRAAVSGARMLSLRVESSGEKVEGGGVWIEPLLIRR